MKFFAVLSSVLAAASAEAQLPIAAQYLAGAGLYNGYQGYAAAPYAAAYGAVDRRFAYGAPINALNAGPLTAGPVAAAYAAAPLVATAPIVGAQYAAAYAAAPVAVAPVAAAPVAAVYAAAPTPVTSSQFQAQDEAGNIAYGYQNINSAKQERGNTYGGVEGSYSYVDEAGVHTVNYVADDLGFRVIGDNLPVAPVHLAVQAPGPLPVQDTAEVVEARAAFHAAFDAINSREKRSAQFALGPLVAHANGAVVPHDTPAVVAARAAHAAAGGAIHPVAAYPYAGAYGLAGAYAGYPAGLNGAYSYAAGLAAPVAAYAAAPVAAYAAAPVAAPLAYAAAPAVAAAAPAREAVLTTIKLNPGHATFYRVD